MTYICNYCRKRFSYFKLLMRGPDDLQTCPYCGSDDWRHISDDEEDSQVSEVGKSVLILDPEEVFSLPEPIRFALLYGHLRSYHEGEMNDRESKEFYSNGIRGSGVQNG